MPPSRPRPRPRRSSPPRRRRSTTRQPAEEKAASALRAIVALDGLLAAAVGADVALDADSLLAALPSSSDVTDTLVLTRFDAMEKSLPGGFDAALSEMEGVKLVHVADDRGRRPLAAMAAQVAEDAATARRQAGRTRAGSARAVPAPRARRRAPQQAG